MWSPIQDIVLIFFDAFPNAKLLIGLGTKTSKFFSSLSAPFLHCTFAFGMLFLSINVIAKERTSLLLMEVHREDVIQISAPSTSSQFSSSPSFGTYPGHPFSANFSRLHPSYL